MTAKKQGQPPPRWRAFFQAAAKRIAFTVAEPKGEPPAFYDEFPEVVAREIVAHGDGPAFLSAARRGRGTHRQNLRYRLLREVERLCGDGVKRRRPDANTPDSLALRSPETLNLEMQ